MWVLFTRIPTPRTQHTLKRLSDKPSGQGAAKSFPFFSDAFALDTPCVLWLEKGVGVLAVRGCGPLLLQKRGEADSLFGPGETQVPKSDYHRTGS